MGVDTQRETSGTHEYPSEHEGVAGGGARQASTVRAAICAIVFRATAVVVGFLCVFIYGSARTSGKLRFVVPW